MPRPQLYLSVLPSNDVYAGSSIILKCIVEVNSTVDTSLTVHSTWWKSGTLLETSEKIVIQPIMQLSATEYQTTVEINIVSMTLDSGAYTCETSIEPNPLTTLISGASSSDMTNIILTGESKSVTVHSNSVFL